VNGEFIASVNVVDWVDLRRLFAAVTAQGHCNHPAGLDKLLGWVIPSMEAREIGLLEQVFGFQMGWEGLYDNLPRVPAADPEFSYQYGEGRFSGLLVVDADS
jgi:hypothetical protein